MRCSTPSRSLLAGDAATNRVNKPSRSAIGLSAELWSGTAFAEAALPIVEAALPIAEAALPIVEAALPIVEAALPIVEAALPIAKAVLPNGR
jgi:hypothetical protein